MLVKRSCQKYYPDIKLRLFDHVETVVRMDIFFY